MLRDSIIIFKKEMKNIFKDKTAVFTIYLLPIVIVPLFFFTSIFIGSLRQQITEKKEYNILIKNNPSNKFQKILRENLNCNFVRTNKFDDNLIIIEFPKFYKEGNNAIVNVYYNSLSASMQYVIQKIKIVINEYNKNILVDQLSDYGIKLSNIYTLNEKFINTAPKDSQGKYIISMLIPYFILVYLFTGSMQVSIDCTAGEKERGGLALLLVNQVSRTAIAAGKTLFVVISSLISGFSSFLGLIIAFRFAFLFNNFSIVNEVFFLNFKLTIVLLMILIVLSGLAASMMVFLGSLAKNSRQASGYILPIYFFTIILGIISMQMNTTKNIYLFFIPIINGVLMLKSIIIYQVSFLQLIITIITNISIFIMIVLCTAKLYNSERILYTI